MKTEFTKSPESMYREYHDRKINPFKKDTWEYHAFVFMFGMDKKPKQTK